MIRIKILISVIIFTFLLITTSMIKNNTREIEKKIQFISKKINLKEKDLNESQLDFSYLTSPSMIEKSLEHLDGINYEPMDFSKIFLNISNFKDIQNKFVIQDNLNEKKIK